MRERFALAGCWWKTDGAENNPIVSLFLGPGGPFLAVGFVKAAVL